MTLRLSRFSGMVAVDKQRFVRSDFGKYVSLPQSDLDTEPRT
jgi:hypothetical protein